MQVPYIFEQIRVSGNDELSSSVRDSLARGNDARSQSRSCRPCFAIHPSITNPPIDDDPSQRLNDTTRHRSIDYSVTYGRNCINVYHRSLNLIIPPTTLGYHIIS